MLIKSTLCMLCLASILLPTLSSADPLLLTPAEMQKLKKYFPNEDVSAPISDNHFVWKGDPIAIRLPLNQEKRLVFPTHVTVDVKGALSSDQLQITNNDQSLYLKALKAFDSTRVYVTLADSQEVVLIDLSTSDKANAETANIDIQQNNHAPPLQTNPKNNVAVLTSSSVNNGDSSNEPNFANALSEGDTYVALTRYAWQQLYAPTRLLSNPLSINRVPMQANEIDATLIYGDKVYAHPLAAWSLNNRYITAVQLRNKYPYTTTLRIPQDICGDWVAIVAYPKTQLAPAGDKVNDSTTIFVLSHQPYAQASEVCHVSASHE